MKLHLQPQDFTELVKLTARHFDIATGFIEKDYWITFILNQLSKSPNNKDVVFKGGTSLTKGYKLINRFSEDIDLAIINENLSGNALRTKIRSVEKEITEELLEITDPNITSKGSMYRKSLFTYPAITKDIAITPKRIILEINAFTNPYPFVEQEITSFIAEYLNVGNQKNVIEQYDLNSFTLNVLDKRRTMVEKIVSLIRFSFSENASKAITSKIRHFYDLYYLANDNECAGYINSQDFQTDLSELIAHDQFAFEEPTGWQTKTIAESPLVTDFALLWENARNVYQNELSKLAYTTIPDEKSVAENFVKLMSQVSILTMQQ